MSAPEHQILDEPNLKNSINIFFSNSSSISHAIYFIIIFLLGILSVGMAIVNVPVYINSRGIIRPSSEVNQILSPIQGIIDTINVHENQFVQKGHLIVKLESDKEKLQQTMLIEEMSLIRKWIGDLKIIAMSGDISPKLVTSKYRIEFRIYQDQMEDIDRRLRLANTDFQRFTRLLKENFISQKEYEESSLKYHNLLAEKSKITPEKQKQWINEQNELLTRESALEKQISEISFFIEKSNVLAPVSGIIQGIRDKYPGEFCHAGKTLCKLIPDTGLIAELFIPPKDIGLIYSGQRVRLLIDSYDYQYWGVLLANCLSISDDVEMVDHNAFYRVICEIQPSPFLEYRKIRVKPGKGMTLTAQFLVSEKNVWQLLKDEAYSILKHP